MNIHEHQAKDIFRKYGIPVQEGVVIMQKNDIDKALDNFEASLYVVKGQIHAGGRGKAGGVKLSKTKAEAKSIAQEMWGKILVTPQTGPEGKMVQRLYVESGCNFIKEFYISIVLDRSNKCISYIASSEGGVEIEEVAETHPDKIIKVQINPVTALQDFHVRKLAIGLGIPNELFKQFQKIVQGLYKAFNDLDANQIEINPMVITDDNRLLVLDAKIAFDDNGLFRHPEIAALKDHTEQDQLETKAEEAGISYVKMDGNIGCMVNGAGLAMATMDIIKLHGSEPANFLDVGGGADKERVTKAFKIILSDPNVKGILVNIFGGIMRCDVIAEGVIAAAKEIGITVPLVVRLAGTNFELGKKILDNSGLKIISASDLGDAASKVVAAIS